MTIKTLTATLAAPLALAVAVPAAAQSTDAAMQSDAMAMSETATTDMASDFTMAAAHSGHFEIESSELALDQSDDEDVQEFAQRMIEEHERMNQKLKQAASGEVPSETGPAQKLVIAGLEGKEGAAFDKAYLEGQVSGHMTTLAFFETMAMDGSDPDLQAFARAGAPAIRQHLEDAKALLEETGAM